MLILILPPWPSALHFLSLRCNHLLTALPTTLGSLHAPALSSFTPADHYFLLDFLDTCFLLLFLASLGILSWFPQLSSFSLTASLSRFPLPAADSLTSSASGPFHVSGSQPHTSAFSIHWALKCQAHEQISCKWSHTSQEPNEVSVIDLIFLDVKTGSESLSILPNFSQWIIVYARIWIQMSLTLKHYKILAPKL